MANNISEKNLAQMEAEIIELEDEPAPELDRALNLTLAGKLLSSNRPSLRNLTYFTSRQWECRNRLKVYDHGRGLYTFEFVKDSDVLKAIQGGPWFIDGKLLLIQRVNPLLCINQLVFQTTKLWVRCYELPPKAFNKKFARAIGDMLGRFCEADLPEEGAENQTVARTPSVRKFLRIKIMVDLDIPLKRMQSIKLKNTLENRVYEITARLAYERLPIFCYRCGLLGHDLENCAGEGPTLYGEWIRAEWYYRNQVDNVQTEASSELMHPTLSTNTKANATSPSDLSPISSIPPLLTSTSVTENPKAGGDNKGKGISSARGKRALTASSSKPVYSPKPKRGRPARGSSKNA